MMDDQELIRLLTIRIVDMAGIQVQAIQRVHDMELEQRRLRDAIQDVIGDLRVWDGQGGDQALTMRTYKKMIEDLQGAIDGK